MRAKSSSASAASRACSLTCCVPLESDSAFANFSISSWNEGSPPIATANPWRRAFRRAASRPATERGPVLFLALLRLAVIFRSDGIGVIPWFRGCVLSLASCRSRATTPLLPSRCLHERLDHRQLQRPIHGVARAVAQPHGPRRSGGRYVSWHCCDWQ